MPTAVPARVRAVLERRRSHAAGPHPDRRRQAARDACRAPAVRAETKDHR